MDKFLKKWNNMGTFQRVMTGINLACSAVVITFGLLFLLDFVPFGLYIAIPLMGVSMLTQCALFWKKDRAMAVFCLLTALFLFGVTAYILKP